MSQVSTLIIDGMQPATGALLSAHAQWAGGRGWLVVSGTFSGPSAVLNVTSITNAGGLDSISATLPAIPNGITAPGTYPFEAPEGLLAISSPAIAAGDNLVASVSLVDVNRRA